MEAVRQWHLAYLLAGLFALLLITGAPPAVAAAITHRLTILHFNDFHGQLAPYRDPQGGPVLGGIARLAGTINQIRAENIQVNGQPLRPDRDYSVVTTDFLAAGGDGYRVLTRLTGRLDTGNLLLDLVAATLRERGAICPGTDGRIHREN